MLLKLNNQKQINRFYKLLPIYKSVICKKINFKANTNDTQLKIITNGLNIKNRKKRITYIYDKTCDLIDKKYKNQNICGFKNCKCFANRKVNNGYKYGCCRMCRYKTDNGCITKNLACKLFNCKEVTNRYNVLKYEDLKTLKLLNIRQRFLVKSDYFSLREDVLKDLYSYSIIYSVLRILYRLLNNYIYVKNVKKKVNL